MLKDIAQDSAESQDETIKAIVSYNSYPKNVCPTTCAVCGDSASGYHYEVTRPEYTCSEQVQVQEVLVI
ncbi:unnamed protein product [Cylicostephanus goldi]|uniref:Nuclear receptor domain-containing protein n=1 Tax=Cylicostephanus goldi TaxID=71465 RepID=A0A3P6QXC2_CYLGO|nr:unnamed protein product [Cylicostephanus goldi]